MVVDISANCVPDGFWVVMDGPCGPEAKSVRLTVKNTFLDVEALAEPGLGVRSSSDPGLPTVAATSLAQGLPAAVQEVAPHALPSFAAPTEEQIVFGAFPPENLTAWAACAEEVRISVSNEAQAAKPSRRQEKLADGRCQVDQEELVVREENRRKEQEPKMRGSQTAEPEDMAEDERQMTERTMSRSKIAVKNAQEGKQERHEEVLVEEVQRREDERMRRLALAANGAQKMEEVCDKTEFPTNRMTAVEETTIEQEDLRRREEEQATFAEEVRRLEDERKKRQAAVAEEAHRREEERKKREQQKSQKKVVDEKKRDAEERRRRALVAAVAEEQRRQKETEDKRAAEEERRRRAEEYALAAEQRLRSSEEAKRAAGEEKERRRHAEEAAAIAEALERQKGDKPTITEMNESRRSEDTFVKQHVDSLNVFEEREPKTSDQAIEDDQSDDEPWDDWNPEVQTALDVILEAERVGAKSAMDADTCPHDALSFATDSITQNNAYGGNDEVDDEDDDDWAPDVQGAANVEDTQNEALRKLLQPTHLIEREKEMQAYETKREADAAGKLLQELKRPPTVLEAKEDIPRGPGVDAEALPEPKYRDMTQEEAIVMVKRGASVGLAGQHGRTPLHKAAEVAYPLLCKAICDAGGNVDPRDKFGETPLLWLAHAASEYENLPIEARKETIQVLLARGADVHAVNPRGRGVLHLASAENDHVVIDTCIEGKADVNAQDLAGFTSLMWAAGRNSVETVKMLLNRRADANIKAIRGQTALTFALTNGNDTVVDILQQHEMLLDEESSRSLADRSDLCHGTARGEEDQKLAQPKMACTKKPAQQVDVYSGKRVYMQAKPDRHSNVYA